MNNGKNEIVNFAQGNIFNSLRDEIINSSLSEDEKEQRLSALNKVSGQNINLMLVGATGSGKSSTINALFDMRVARVGVGVDPETKDIQKYDLVNLTIWDTPGLGDTVDKDKKHLKQIVQKLSETDGQGNMVIDLVMVVLDASSKDLKVSFDLINNTLIPILGKDKDKRILIAINQSDMAMKGRHWNHEQNAPDVVLEDFLNKKSDSVKNRILDATGVTIEPICYCAGYSDENTVRQNPYNLTKLLYYILLAVPLEKRLLLANNLNMNEKHWAFNDEKMDYYEAVKGEFFESLLSNIGVFAEKGAVIGGYAIGIPGIIIGGLAGAIVGGLHSLIIMPLSKLKVSQLFQILKLWK